METLNYQDKSKTISWIMLGIAFICIAVFHFFHEPSWLMFALMGMVFFISGVLRWSYYSYSFNSNNPMSEGMYVRDRISRKIFAGSLLLGLGIGKLLGFTSEGLFIGMGIGFLLKALFPLLSMQKEEYK